MIIWDQFLQRRQEFPHRANVLNSVLRYLQSVDGNAVTPEDDWFGMMSRIGLSTNFQHRIMKPEVEIMRLSGSLKHWVAEMLDIRYEFLKGLDRIIKELVVTTLGRISSKPALDGSFTTVPPASISPPVHAESSKMIPSSSSSAPQPQIAILTTDPPKQLDGHVMLLKGAARPRLDMLFLPSGQLNFAAIGSTPPGDFSKSFRDLYFTKSYEVLCRMGTSPG